MTARKDAAGDAGAIGKISMAKDKTPIGELPRVPRVAFPTIRGYRFIQGIAVSPHAEVHLPM